MGNIFDTPKEFHPTKELISKKTKEFKIPLNSILKGDNRDIIITEREYRKDKQNCYRKWYKYTCNKTGYTDNWAIETRLLDGQSCLCCCKNNKKPILGINTIWDTDRWMCDLGVDETWAKSHISQSNSKALCKCPNCGNEKYKVTSDIYYDKSIGCKCGDGISYPEKIMISILDQLHINYMFQYSPDYLIQKKEKSSRKRSDFYLREYNLIIEIDGGLGHKNGNIHTKSNKTLEECIDIDKWKDEQHELNGNEVVRIDCLKSNLVYIKSSILNSKLNTMFNFKTIDWLKVDEFAFKNNFRFNVCQYWNNKKEWETTKDLADKFKVSKSTIVNYLNKGTELGWCNYSGINENIKSASKVGKKKGKVLEVFKDDVFLGEFKSCAELSRVSEEIFKIKFDESAISRVCRGVCESYKGYKFKYINKY